MKKKIFAFAISLLAFGGISAVSADVLTELEEVQRDAYLFNQLQFREEARGYVKLSDCYALNLCHDVFVIDAADEGLARAHLETIGYTSSSALDAVTFYAAHNVNTTGHLGIGERVGVLHSWQQLSNKLYPETETEWEDMLKIGTGHWPSVRNILLEEAAIGEFQTVYQRQPDFSNMYDESAVMIMAYGLRPDDRNLDSEAAAIGHFKAIYGGYPDDVHDWDVVRAIAYSGATR